MFKVQIRNNAHKPIPQAWRHVATRAIVCAAIAVGGLLILLSRPSPEKEAFDSVPIGSGIAELHARFPFPLEGQPRLKPPVGSTKSPARFEAETPAEFERLETFTGTLRYHHLRLGGVGPGLRLALDDVSESFSLDIENGRIFGKDYVRVRW